MISFVVSEGRLRPFWRFFISAFATRLIFLGSSLLVLFVAHPPQTEPGRPHLLLTIHLVRFVLLALLFRTLAHHWEAKPFASVGFGRHSRWGKELALGLGWGALLIFLQAALMFGAGVAEFSLFQASAGRVISSGLFLLVFFVPAAAFEELAFRGYPFQRLIESVGPVAAVVALSALFGLAHAANPHSTVLSVFNTGLAGAAFCVGYLKTRALWFPVGLHFSWNFFQGCFFGFPVSGFEGSGFPTIFTVNLEGPAYWTGGEYGMEGTFGATIVILLLLAYLGKSRVLFVSAEMRSMLGAKAETGSNAARTAQQGPESEKGRVLGL